MILRLLQLSGMALGCLWASGASAVDVTAEFGVVSDYRYRGLTLSDGKPAVQASVALEHDSGLYLNVWSSSIKEPGTRIDLEIDVTGGFELPLNDKVSLDLSGTYYLYPSDPQSNYFEATAVMTAERGQAAASLGWSVVPAQGATRDELGGDRGNSYFFGEVSYEISGAPVTLTARLGYERGFFDEVEGGGKWDWSVGGEWTVGKVSIGIGYAGCGPGRVESHALVGSLLFAF